jgi:uncharacterized protein
MLYLCSPASLIGRPAFFTMAASPDKQLYPDCMKSCTVSPTQTAGLFDKNLYIAYMLTRSDIEHKLQAIRPELADRFHVSKIGYFGSFSTNQQTDSSDLDLLVEFSKPVGWEFFTLESYLEQALGIRVDLVTKNALKDQIKESILNQVQYI